MSIPNYLINLSGILFGLLASTRVGPYTVTQEMGLFTRSSISWALISLSDSDERVRQKVQSC